MVSELQETEKYSIISYSNDILIYESYITNKCGTQEKNIGHIRI